MGKEALELKEIQTAIDMDKDEEPRLGRKRSKTNELGLPEGTEMRYFVACIADPENRIELERIMTKSLQCAGRGNTVKEPGDIFVINETGSFDRDGCYQVVVKYLYLPE